MDQFHESLRKSHNIDCVSFGVLRQLGRSPPPRNRVQTISGQVFIVTKAQQAIRLPLVTIFAVPGSAVLKFRESRLLSKAELENEEKARIETLEVAAIERRAEAMKLLPSVERRISTAAAERSVLQNQIDEKKKKLFAHQCLN